MRNAPIMYARYIIRAWGFLTSSLSLQVCAVKGDNMLIINGLTHFSSTVILLLSQPIFVVIGESKLGFFLALSSLVYLASLYYQAADMFKFLH